jgi:hypothetical protein
MLGGSEEFSDELKEIAKYSSLKCFFEYFVILNVNQFLFPFFKKISKSGNRKCI